MCQLFIVFREQKIRQIYSNKFVFWGERWEFFQVICDEKNINSREICLRRNYRDNDT
jgi:hypothetical protein